MLNCKERKFEKYGLYDESLRIVSDWKFFFEILIIQNCCYKHWNRVVVNFAYDGISSLPENLQICNSDRRQVLKNYNRIIRSIEKRDRRIQELDLPVMEIIRQRIRNKVKRLL